MDGCHLMFPYTEMIEGRTKWKLSKLRYATASLAALTSRALTIFRAGFALNTVGFGERIDAAPRLGGWFLDHHEFGKSGHHEGS
jgi:hypothetical protein